MSGAAGFIPDAPGQGPPRRFGRYDVIAELARGGMGTVYLARHAGEAGFQRLFAVKVLHPHLAEDNAFINMLHDEARIAACIHHPNVVPIFDLGTENGLYYVVMEYVEGCTLSLLLRRNPNRRPARIIVQILIDALEGLHAAHTLTNDEGTELQLVHRDISPQNILVGIDGAGHITDFGVAKAETRITATMPGVRKGKIAYMAPEQIIDDGANIDRRVDIFSAGAVLWNALTGLSLFRGESDAATLHNILDKKVPKPSSAGLRPPPFLDAICSKALERDPAQRFQTAQEMAEALRQVAIKNSCLGSRTEITEWVNSSFHDEFVARRQAVREAAKRRESETRTDITLPALPEMLAPVQTGTGPSATTASPAGTSHSLSFQVASQSPSRRGMLILGALAGGIILLLLILLLVRSNAPPQTGIPAQQPPRSATAPEQPGTVETKTPAAEPNSATEAEPSAASSAHEGSKHVFPRRWSAAPAPSSRPAAAAAETSSKQAPLPQPAPQPAVERNPYLRRR